MAIVTLVAGTLLSLIGIGGYLLSDPRSLTALIPLAFGSLLEVSGALALRPELKKHAMHAASLIALLGTLGSAAGAFRFAQMLTGTPAARPVAVMAQTAMFVVCAVLLALCVRSFRQARARREAAGAA